MSSESDYGDSALEDLKGLDLLAALQIPLQPLVYDPATQSFLQVTDRNAPVGLCSNYDSESGLYYTLDELYAMQQGSNDLSFERGFPISTTPKKIFQEYGIKKTVTATLPSGETFQYYRHFQVAAAGFTYFHKTLGYLHDSEVEQVEEVDEKYDEDNMNSSPQYQQPHTPTGRYSFVNTPASAMSSLVQNDTQLKVQHQLTDKVKLKHLDKLTVDDIQAHRRWKLTDTANLHSIETATIPTFKMIDDLFVGRQFVSKSGQYCGTNGHGTIFMINCCNALNLVERIM